jgi:hypothetical protein
MPFHTLTCPVGAGRRRRHQDKAAESEEKDATPEIYSLRPFL